MPSIGVLVLAYARPNLLQAALESVAAQRRPPDEVIVLDDCSPEPLSELVAPIPGLDIRFIRHDRNQGPGAAARTLLDSSRAELVAFLNDDDLWYPEFLAECEAALGSEPSAALSFCDHDVIDADGAENPSQSHLMSVEYGRAELPPGRCDALPLLAAVTQTIAAASFALYRRWALQSGVVAAGGAAWDYFAGLSAAGTGASAVFVPKRLGAYRLSPSGITATNASRRTQADAAVSKLRGLCWLIRQPGTRPWRRRLALEVAVQSARALKAAVLARHPPTGVQAGLALVGVDLLRPASWPRP